MIDVRQIVEHMEVVGSDGEHVGKVDHILAEQIELAKFDWGAGLKHHLIPTSWVERVDEKVHLSLSRDAAKAAWQEKGDGAAADSGMVAPSEPPKIATSDNARLDEALEESFPASDPVSAKHID